MTRFSLLLLVVMVLTLPACGRKPHDVDAPSNAVTYTYPPLETDKP